MNLYELILDSAEKHPEKMAVIESERRISYEELVAEIQDLARELKSFGVKEKDKIGILLPNSSFYIAVSYAIWANNASIVPISVDLSEKEIHFIIQSIDLDAVISYKPILLKDEDFCKADDFFHHSYFYYSYEGAATRHKHDDVNMAFLRFTSGTTSASKGVVLCHETVLERITAANKALKIGVKDNIIWMLSMAHHFTVSIVLYLTNGATITLCKNHLAKAVLETTNRERGTIIYTTPFHLKMLSEDISTQGLPSVRLVISTAMALSQNVAKNFYKRFSIPLTQAYGIIEIGLPCINFDDPINKLDSVGKVLPDYKIKFVDPNNPDELNSESGEIYVKGPGTLDAYYIPWTPRRVIMKDGWFATGDLGRFDEDGSLHITGRKKDLINIAGMKFFPNEVESVLDKYEIVEESYVYPVFHESLGEVLNAKVVLNKKSFNDEIVIHDLYDYCKKNFVAYKVPRKIEIVDKLPKTFSGKLKRHYRTYSEGNLTSDFV